MTYEETWRDKASLILHDDGSIGVITFGSLGTALRASSEARAKELLNEYLNGRNSRICRCGHIDYSPNSPREFNRVRHVDSCIKCREMEAAQ